MEAVAPSVPRRSKLILSILFVLGIVVLAGTWIALYWEETLFTESHLVGYYCCVTEQELPAPGTLERTLSDFFRTLPGMHLPSLIFVVANVGLFAISLRRGGRDHWWLPFLFAVLGILYLLVDFELVAASWSISDGLVSPQTSAYKGYQRTGYGIVVHLMLWVAYFVTLSVVIRKLLPKPRSDGGPNSSRGDRPTGRFRTTDSLER
jgi:hypothetical protein